MFIKNIEKSFIHISFGFMILLGVILGGCTGSEPPLLPEFIASDVEHYNKEVVINAPVIWNDFKIVHASVVLEISSKTETVVVSPTRDIRLFFYNEHTGDWEKTSNTEQYGAGLQKIIMRPNESAILPVTPERIKMDQSGILLLITVSGTVLANNTKTDVFHSYIVVRLS